MQRLTFSLHGLSSARFSTLHFTASSHSEILDLLSHPCLNLLSSTCTLLSVVPLLTPFNHARYSPLDLNALTLLRSSLHRTGFRALSVLPVRLNSDTLCAFTHISTTLELWSPISLDRPSYHYLGESVALCDLPATYTLSDINDSPNIHALLSPHLTP